MRFGSLSLMVILLAIVSISINPSTTWQLVDPQGHPVEGAYIAYHYIGDTFKIIKSGSYFRSGSVVRTDSTGKFYIPWAFHLHLPFSLQGNLSTYFGLVYAPPLHNTFSSLGGAYEENMPRMAAVPGYFEMNRETRIVKLFDMRENPSGWAQTIESLYHFIRFDLVGKKPLAEYRASSALKREFIQHVRREYDLFMVRYSNVNRDASASHLGLQYEREACDSDGLEGKKIKSSKSAVGAIHGKDLGEEAFRTRRDCETLMIEVFYEILPKCYRVKPDIAAFRFNTMTQWD